MLTKELNYSNNKKKNKNNAYPMKFFFIFNNEDFKKDLINDESINFSR